jgi:hypothetical protein
MRVRLSLGIAGAFLCGTSPTAAQVFGGSPANAVPPVKAQVIGGSPANANPPPVAQIIRGSPGDASADPAYGLVAKIIFTAPDGRSELCSGTFVGPRAVLTAGHCACGVPESYRIAVEEPSTKEQQAFRLSKNPIIFDQRSCSLGIVPGGDLALLVTASDYICTGRQTGLRPRIIGPGTKPANASDTCQSFPGASGILGSPISVVWQMKERLTRGVPLKVVGYGLTESGGRGRRLTAPVPLLSAACDDPRLWSVCAPYAEMLLVDTKPPGQRHDTCNGDSGGPVFDTVNGRSSLVAVTSRAVPVGADDPNGECGGGGIYELIGRKSIISWLRGNGVEIAAAIAGPKISNLKDKAPQLALLTDSPFGALVKFHTKPKSGGKRSWMSALENALNAYSVKAKDE